MPKKKEPISPEEQVKRFEAEVQRLIDAGELNPIEAEDRLHSLIGAIAKLRSTQHREP